MLTTTKNSARLPICSKRLSAPTLSKEIARLEDSADSRMEKMSFVRKLFEPNSEIPIFKFILIFPQRKPRKGNTRSYDNRGGYFNNGSGGYPPNGYGQYQGNFNYGNNQMMMPFCKKNNFPNFGFFQFCKILDFF